jgi:hypothetical protein
MRQVFTSPRLENVEAVAEMLRAQGIEVRVSEARSYRGNRRSNFSYREREGAGPQPAVWILRAEDQPRGRQLLREAGLLESSRAGEGSYLPVSKLGPQPEGRKGLGGAMRAKLGVLGLIGLVIGLAVFGVRKHDQGVEAAAAAAAARPAPPPLVPQMVEQLQTYSAAVPTALARLLVEDALASRSATAACLQVDAAPAPALLMESRAAAPVRVATPPACPDDALAIAIGDYTTDGSGLGSVTLTVGDDPPRELQVERDGSRWRILPAR